MTDTLAPEASHLEALQQAEPLPRQPLIQGGHDYGSLTDLVCGIVEKPMPRWWWPAFLVSLAVLGVGVFAAAYLIATGVGVWGLNQPVGWAFDITNFVFWVGIGHAGTLISAILLLFRQKWRTSINRFAEAMTIFAVACAGIFPLIHVGRIWFIWFVAPIPNSNAIWPNFRSPLLWDVFAVSTYATVSLMFWYVGLIPDLATLRDRATSTWRHTFYGLLALGWRGSARHWQHYEIACLLLAGLSTPLVVSVHTIVSFDFAMSVIPGWHTTVFPPYFVAGAIFSGFAMVITLMIPVRELFGLRDIMTDRHLELMSKVILATGMMVGYAYSIEFFTAWYSANEYEQFVFLNRAFGPYAWAYWIMVSCNVLSPQVFWFKKCRQNPWILFTISIFVNIGMWFERYVIIVTSLHRDFLPSSWGYFTPTWVDLAQMIGSFGLFFTLFLLFLRFLPMIALFEVKSITELPRSHGTKAGHAIDPLQQSMPKPVALKSTARASEPVPATSTPAGHVLGILVAYRDPHEVVAAVEKTRAAGYSKVETHSPFPLHGVDKALGLARSKLPFGVLAGGVFGFAFGLWGMLYVNTVAYPLITDGKPYGAIEPLVPILFEATVLFAAFATVGGMLFLNGLPRYCHPLFDAPGFDRATSDKFFLYIDGSDSQFHAERTCSFVRTLSPSSEPVLVKG